VQVGISNVHEILREEIVKHCLDPAMDKSWRMVAAATLALISIEVSAVAAETPEKLSGAKIRAKFAGMQLTDEVHWRYVYDRDGRLRSYSMERRRLANGRSRRTSSAFISGNRTMVVTKFRSRADASR
jgi:hypothetical protein